MVSGRGCILSIGFFVTALIAGWVSIANTHLDWCSGAVPCQTDHTLSNDSGVICLVFVVLALVSGVIGIRDLVRDHREPLGDGDSGEYYRCTACSAPVRSTAPRCPRCHNQKTDFFDLPRRE